MISERSNGLFGIYVHWPFCAAKCPYCDFNSHVAKTPVDQDEFVKAYIKELSHFAALTPGRTVQSIFFGGGTPSLMEAKTVETILETIADFWSPLRLTRPALRRAGSRIIKALA